MAGGAAAGAWLRSTRASGDMASAPEESAKNSRRSIFMGGRLIARGAEIPAPAAAARPSPIRCAGPLGLEVPEGVLAGSPSCRSSRFSARVFSHGCRFPRRCRRRGRACRASTGRAARSGGSLAAPNQIEGLITSGAPERGRPPEKGVEADQPAHRRSRDDRAVAILPGAVLAVDAGLDRVDQETDVPVAVAAAVLRVGERTVFGQPSRRVPERRRRSARCRAARARSARPPAARCCRRTRPRDRRGSARPAYTRRDSGGVLRRTTPAGRRQRCGGCGAAATRVRTNAFPLDC